MMVLITYDVNKASPSGARRLRQVAKTCQDYGQRVQNSVFECVIQNDQFVILKDKLESIMDKENDSIRFYFLGKNWQRKVEMVGRQTSFDPEGTLIV